MLSQRKKRLLGLVVLGVLVGFLHDVFAEEESKPPAFGDGDLVKGLNATLLGGVLGTGSDGSGGLLGLVANTTNATGLVGGLTAPGGPLSNTGEGIFSPESKAVKDADDKITDPLDKLDKAVTGDGKAYVGTLGVLGINVTSGLAYRALIGGFRGASGTLAQKAVGANATVDDSWTGMAKDIAAEAVADQVLGEDGMEPKLGRNVAGIVHQGLNKTLNFSDAGVVEKVGEAYDNVVGAKLKSSFVEKYARDTVKGTVKGALNNGVVEGALDGKRRRKRKKRDAEANVLQDNQSGMQSLPGDNLVNPSENDVGG